MDLTPVRRSSDGAVVAGVCAGMAKRWGIDPLIVRIAMVLLALLGGIGVAVYLGAVLLVPKQGGTEFPVRTMLPFTRDWPATAVIGAVVGLGALLIGMLSGVSPIGIGPAIGLGFLWYFGFYRNRQGPAVPSVGSGLQPAAPPPNQPGPNASDFERAAVAWQQRVAETRQLSAAPAPPTDLVPPQVFASAAPTPGHQRELIPVGPREVTAPSLPVYTAAAPRVRARWIWPATACLVGLVLAGLAVASVLGVTVPALAFVAAALGCVGLALVVSTWFGRPRFLLLTGMVLAVATMVIMVPAGPAQAPNVGDETLLYTSAAELPGTHVVDAGDLVVDLSKVQISADTHVSFTVRLGSLAVTVPPGTRVVTDWTVGAGDFTRTEDGRSTTRDGLNIGGTITSGPDSGPTLFVHLKVALGDLTVIQ